MRAFLVSDSLLRQGETREYHIPSQWTPGSGEEKDKDADKGDGSRLRGRIGHNDITRRVLCGGRCSQNSHNELRDTHSNRAAEKQGPTTPFVDRIQPRKGGPNVDAVDDQVDDKLILHAGILEELSTVIDDEIDTGQLLEGLEAATCEETFSQISLEALQVAGLSKPHLIIVVRLDFGDLLADCLVIGREAPDLCQIPSCCRGVVFLDHVPRRLGNDKHPNHENGRPGELDSNGDTVRAGVLSRMGRIVHDRSEEQSDGDCPLIRPDDKPTNPLGSRLGLVERNCTEHRVVSDTWSLYGWGNRWSMACTDSRPRSNPHPVQRKIDLRGTWESPLRWFAR